MRANARVKWRFRRSAASVSLRDEFKTNRLQKRQVLQKTCRFQPYSI